MASASEQRVGQLLHEEAVRRREPVHLDQRPALGQLLPQRERLDRGADGCQRPQPGARREVNSDMATPRVAHPVDRFGEAEAVERLLRCGDALPEAEVTVHWLALAVGWAVDGVDGPVASKRLDQWCPGP